MNAALESERGQPCPRVESEEKIRADTAVRAPDAKTSFAESELGALLSSWTAQRFDSLFSSASYRGLYGSDELPKIPRPRSEEGVLS